MPREHHRRRSSRDSSARRNRRRSREFYYNNPAAPSAPRAADSVYTANPGLNRRGSRSSLSSSSSSSYMEIRNSPPRRGNVFTTFFTAPSEHRRRSRRRARAARILPFGNSSSSSVDSDLAYGTGYVRRPRDSRRSSHHNQSQQHYRDDYRTPSQYQWEGPQQPQHDPRYARSAAPEGYPQPQPYNQQSDPHYQPSHDSAYQQYYSQPPAEPQQSREPRVHADSSTATPTTSFAGPAIGAGLGLAAASALASGDSRQDRSGRDRDRNRREDRGRRRPRDDREDQYMSSTADSNATPRPGRMQRRSTDEEIMHIGRELTRLHSDIDSRPTGLKAGSSKKDRDRGIASSRPYEGAYSSDDEGGEWESVSSGSESGKEDFLAYGSTVSYPQAPSRPVDTPSTVEAPPPGRSTLVDPRYFGPQNSLNGFVSPLPSTTRPPPAPMQQVQAVPMDDERGSIPPTDHVYPKLSRPTDVQLEQPKPVAPVSPERLERSSYSEKHDRKVSDGKDRKTSSSGKVLTGAALATAAGVVGHTILSDNKAKEPKRARAEEESRRDEYRDSSKQDRRVAEERERERQKEEEERRRKLIDAEYEEYLRSMRRKSSGDRSHRTKHDDSGRPQGSRKEEPKEPRESVDQPQLPSSQQKSTGDYFDYRRVSHESRAGSKAPIDPFQFQVADDAFPTPTYSRRATPDREREEVLRDAPQVYTVEREPSFSPPRLSRKDSFEIEQMAEDPRNSPIDRLEEEEAALKRAYEEAKRRANSGASPDIIPASKPDEDSATRGRRTRDPVLEEADEFYRKSEAARRTASEDMRSRSTSPDHSVVGKWQEHDEDESGIVIVTPPGAEHHEQPGPYDKPNADVRVDTVFDHPKEFTRFLRRRARSGSDGQPHLGTRDPSAERERPLLNLVRPTPVPSPSLERRREREKARTARSGSRSQSQTRSREVDGNESEATLSKGVSSANVVIGPRGEVVDLVEEQPSERKEDIPAPPADRSLEEYEKPNKHARTVWGVVNTALAGKFASSVLDKEPATGGQADEEDTRAAAAPGVDIVDEEPLPRTREFDGARSEAVSQRDIPGDRDVDVPPLPDSQPGSKPSSPEQREMPGSFGDDLEFAATLGAGLKAAGFDDNIAVDDPQYRRRDSPPGSNDELGSVPRDAPSAVEPSPEDEWGTSMRGKKKKKAKKAKQETSAGPETDSTPAPEERSAEPIEIVEPAELAQRSGSPELSRDAPIKPAETTAPPGEESWAPSKKLSKKERKLLAKKAAQAPFQDEKPAVPAPKDEVARKEGVEQPFVTPEESSRELPRSFGDTSRDLHDEPREPPTMPDDEFPLKKLSKKERKALAKKKAAEAQLQGGEPGGEPVLQDSLDEHRDPIQEGSRELPVEEPSEPATVPQEDCPPGDDVLSRGDVPPPEDDMSIAKLSKKERKRLAKEKAAEVQLQVNQPTPTVLGEEVIKDVTEDSPTPLDEGPRRLPVEEPHEPAAVSYERSWAEDDAQRREDAPPTEEDLSLKKLTKKERKALAKKKAAGAQLQEDEATSAAPENALVVDKVTDKAAEPFEEGPRDLTTEEPGEPSTVPEEAVGPSQEGAGELVTEEPDDQTSAPIEDALALDDNFTPPKNLTKKEQRKLAKKQKAAQLDGEPVPEPPKEDSADTIEADPAPAKAEDAWDIAESPPAETITSPTADDDVWHEAVEEVPQEEEKTPRDAPDVIPEGNTARELPTMQEEESFAVPSKKKKKKKKGAAALETTEDIPVEETSKEQLPKDDQSTDQQAKDDQHMEEQPRDLEPAQPVQEEDAWATPTKKGKKGKKNRRKLDAWADPEPPDAGADGHTNGHANGHDQTKSGDIGEDPFLANAGTPGEGVGLPGAAAAVVAASAAVAGFHATDSPSDKTEKPSDSARTVGPDSQEIPGLGEGSQVVDPDIVPRQVKYVIDPQHGDLLTLPPSRPTSPGESVDVASENLPQLPDSRPDTPPEEAYKRELLKSRRRKSTQESSHTRSTSETSIPLPLLLGQRSNPSSPRFVRPSPTSSPSSSAADTKKPFSRPISWDGKKDIRPLILPTRQGNESPSRSISPLKDHQQRELGPSPTIGLGLSEPRHIDAASDIPETEESAVRETVEGIASAEESNQVIEFSTPTKKKGKGKATPDDLARPDSDESASVPDNSQEQDRALAWEDAFEVPETRKDESVEDAAPTSADLVEPAEPVLKKDKRKKKKKQSLDISPEDVEKPSEPILEAPSAPAESEKSSDTVLALETEAIAPEPSVEAERSLEPEPPAVQDEPVMTKAEKKKAKKKKKGTLTREDPQLTEEPEKPAEEQSVEVPAERSVEPAAGAAAEPLADLPAEASLSPSSEVEEQRDVIPEAPTEAELSPAKSKKGKRSRSYGDDVVSIEAEKFADKEAVEEQATETEPPVELVAEPSGAEYTAARSVAEAGADVSVSEKAEPAVSEPFMTKAEKKKARKKKKGSQPTWGDVSTAESEKTQDDKTLGRPFKAPTEREHPADEKPIEEPSTVTPGEPEELADQKPLEEQPSETPEFSADTEAVSAPIVPDSEELVRSITESPQDEPAPTTKGKKNKKKKKASQSLWTDEPAAGPDSAEQPINEKQVETPVEAAVNMLEEPTTEEPSQPEEASPRFEQTVVDSKGEVQKVEEPRPERTPVQDQPSEPTYEPEDVSTRDTPLGDDIGQPISGKKAKKKKKKGSIWNEPEAPTPAMSEEQSSASAESSEAPKQLALEDTTPADSKKGESKDSGILDSGETALVSAEPETELQDTATGKPAPEELQPVLNKQEVEDKWSHAAEELGANDAEATLPLATEEALSDPSPPSTSADDEVGQQLGKKKKKKKGAEAAVEEASAPETGSPSEGATVTETLGGDKSRKMNDQVEVAVPETREIPEATPREDDQPDIAGPEPAVTDDATLKKDGQTEAPRGGASSAPVGKKAKKGKKKRGSVDESATLDTSSAADELIESKGFEDSSKDVITEPASETTEQVIEPPSGAPEGTVLVSSEDGKPGDASTDQPTATAEDSRDTREQSAPDTTTGAEESSSTVLESALSGKKSKKKKKKSVSFADLPPEPTSNSTVSPMPEKEDDLADVPVETRTEKDRELDHSLNEAWDDAWSSPTPEPSGLSSDAPVEESAVPVSPKSKKKKKKKGKAVDNLAFNSDADVSAPPTPVEEPRGFPAAWGISESDREAKDEPSSDTPKASYTPTLVKEPAIYTAAGELSDSGNASVGTEPGENYTTESVSPDAIVPNVSTGAELEGEPISEKAENTGDGSPREGVTDSAAESRDSPPASRQLEPQPTTKPPSTADVEPTDEGSSMPSIKKDKKKKKKSKGATTAEPELISEPTKATESEPTLPEPVASEPTESLGPVAPETANPETLQQETLQADAVDEWASAPTSKKDKKKKKKREIATPGPEPEPVSAPAEPVEPIGPEPEPEPEPAAVDADDPSASVTESVDLVEPELQPLKSSAGLEPTEAAPEAEQPLDETPATKKGRKKKKGKDVSESEPEHRPEIMPGPASTQAGPLDESSSTSTAEKDKSAANTEPKAVTEPAFVERRPSATDDLHRTTHVPAPEPSSETIPAAPETAEDSQAATEQSEAADEWSLPTLTKKGKKKKKKSKGPDEQLSTPQPDSVVKPPFAEAEPTQPGTPPSAPDATIVDTAEPSSHQREHTADPVKQASGETKDLAGTPGAELQDEPTSAVPAEHEGKTEETAQPVISGIEASQDKSIASEPADTEAAPQSELQSKSQPDDWLATPSSKKVKKKKGKKKDQASAELETSAELTTTPEPEQPPVTDPTTGGKQPQAEDSFSTPEAKSQTGETHELELPSEETPLTETPLPFEAASSGNPQTPDENSSAVPLSKKDKKKKKKGKLGAEPEPEPEPVEQRQEPKTPAETEQPTLESESVGQAQMPETPADTDELALIPDEPSEPAVGKAAKSQEAEDDSLSSSPMSKKEKKKKKKAKAALQLESPTESERESAPATAPATEGETVPDSTPTPITSEAVETPETQDSLEPQDDRGLPDAEESKTAPTVGSSVEAEEAAAKPTERTTPSDTPTPEPAPTIEEPSVPTETPSPESASLETVPVFEDEPTPRGSTEEPTVPGDDWSQTPLSKKDKKKKKKAKAKAEAEVAQVPESEAPPATATEDVPTVPLEEPLEPVGTMKPEVEDPFSTGDNDREAETIVKEPVPESEPTETTTAEEWARTPAKGKKGKKQKKKAKALESAQTAPETTPTADDVPKTDSTPALQEPAEPSVPIEAGFIEEPLKSAEAVELAPEGAGPSELVEPAELSDKAERIEETAAVAKPAPEAAIEGALSLLQDKEKEGPGIEESIVPSEPEAQPDESRAVTDEQPQDLAPAVYAPEQGDDEWALPAKKKGKKKGKKSMSLDPPEPAVEEKESKQHPAEKASTQPSITEGRNDVSSPPVTDETPQEAPGHNLTTKGEGGEMQNPVMDVENLAGPAQQIDDAVIADTTAVEPPNEPSPEAKPSAPLAEQFPEESSAPKPSESAEDPPPIEDVADRFTSKKDKKKKKKGKKSRTLEESDAEKAGDESPVLDKLEGEAPSVPANEEPVEQPVDVNKDVSEARLDEPGPEVTAEPKEPPADKQQAESATPATTDAQEPTQDKWALSSKKSKKGKKKRSKATSEATTPVPSRPMSPVLDELAAPSDKPSEDIVPAESSGKVAPEAVPQSVIETADDADRSLQEPSAETNIEPARDEQNTTRGLPPASVETAPEAEASLATPVEADQKTKTLKTPGDEPSAVLEGRSDGKKNEKEDKPISNVSPAEVRDDKLSTNLPPQDAQESGISSEPSQMEIEEVKPDEAESIAEEWPSTKSKKKKGKKAKKGTSTTTTPAVSRPESPAAEERSMPLEEVTEETPAPSEPAAISSEAGEDDKPASESVPETVQPKPTATAELVEQEPEADEWGSVRKNKKGKKGKKKGAASSGTITLAVSRPSSPVTVKSEPSLESKEPEPPVESIPAETEDVEMGPASPTRDDSKTSVSRERTLPEETSQPLFPVLEEPPPQTGVDVADIWGPSTMKKKNKGKKGKERADAAPEGAGLGLFRPASPARDDTLQSFRAGHQGETGARTGELSAESGSRADTSETREFPAAADDRGAGGAEGQDAAKGGAPAIAQPLPAADEEASAYLHATNRPESVPISAEVETTDGTRGEPTVSRQDSDDWDSASTKAKGRKGEKKGKHVHEVAGASIDPSAAADEDIRIPEKGIDPDITIPNKPDPRVSGEPSLEPPVPEEERHESNTSLASEPSIKPDVQSEVQPKVSSRVGPQIESSIQPDISSAEILQEAEPGVEPPARKEVVEEPEATFPREPASQAEGENTDLAAESSTSRGPPEPETESVLGNKTRIPTKDATDDGYNVPKKKGKKGKKKGKSSSATPVESRPLTPVDEDTFAPSSELHHAAAPNTPAPAAETEAEVAKDEPAAPEQVPDEWAITPKKKKKGKKGEKGVESPQTTPAVSRPMSPVQVEPKQDQRARPDETASVQAGDIEPPVATPVEEGAGSWGFTSMKRGKKSEERGQSPSAAASTSRPASPVIDEWSKDQETTGERSAPAQVDLELTVPTSAEGEVEDWGFTTSKEDKTRAPLAYDSTTSVASQAISPTWAVTETESPLLAPTEAQLAEDESALLSSKKKGKKKHQKAKTEYDAADEPLDQALSLPEEQPREAIYEPPAILAPESDSPDMARESLPQSPQEAHRSPSQAQESHLTPAQASSHITHDAPSGEAARPEKKPKTEDVDSLMLSEPIMPVKEPVKETSTIGQPAETLETATNAGNVEDVPLDPQGQQQTRTLDKGEGVDTTSTLNIDDPLLETKLNEDKTKTAVGAAAAAAAGVATLADKFGGQTSTSKKKGKKKKIVDKKMEREEDLFDDPLLWESPDKKTLMEGDAGDEDGFWGGGGGGETGHRGMDLSEPMAGVEESREAIGDKPAEPVEGEREMEDVTIPAMAKETAMDVMTSDPEESGAQGALDETGSAAVEEGVSPEKEPSVPQWRMTRKEIQDVEEEEAKTSEVEDRWSLEGMRAVRAETEEQGTSPVASERGLAEADVTEHSQPAKEMSGLARLERTWEEPDESPILGRGETREGQPIAEEMAQLPPVTPTRGLTPVDDSSRGTARSTLEESPFTPLRRSMSRNLEPVPEEEPETFGSPGQAKERRSRKLPTSTADINRDSGFATNSPRHSQRSQWQQEGPHRDSGVHLKDWAESPRQISPEPSSSRPRDVFKTPEISERHLKRSPRSAKDLRDQEHHPSRTPVFREPSPQAPTPEPQKSLRDYKTPDAPQSRYQDLGGPSLSTKRPSTPRLARAAALSRSGTDSPLPRSSTDSPVPGQRSVSDNVSRPRHTPSPDLAPRRVASNTSLTRHRTPDPKLRPDTPGSIRSLHSATPPLRRAGRRISGDLRSISLSQRGQAEAPPSADSSDEQRSAQNSTPVANEGRVRAKDMTDVYDGFGEGRIGSPRSPTRPHSMRRRQSMQVIELESQVNELLVQNQMLQQERQQYSDQQSHAKKAQSLLADRDAEIDALKRSIEQLNREVSRLVEVNEGLNAANAQLSNEQNSRYRDLELLHAEASRELETTRGTQDTYNQQLQDKDAEIADLRDQLETAKAKIQEMQEKILETSRPADADFLDLRDVDYFDRRCQQLCQHVQQWVLRFSKFSDMRSCRLTNEINDEKIIDRLDNTILDGSDVDAYLRDRVRRRDIFMSMTMNMIWEFVFTRYLFGMDREQRQKLKSLEKHLTEVGPPNAVRQWRAVTLTLLSRRSSFKRQRELDCEAVVQAVLETLSLILPPPTHLEDQIQSTLRRVMTEAVDLAVMMRTQRAEYMMLPPLEPKYDADGELAETVTFNASLMNERSGDRSQTNEELQTQAATVRVVLFPLVVRKGDENGVGDDEVVVCPAQVLIARSRRKSRGVTPSDLGGAPIGGSAHTLAHSEYMGTDL